MKRYMMKRDNDGVWYLVPIELWKLFDEMMKMDWEEWTTEDEQFIESMRIDGPHMMTFTNPEELKK